MLSKFANILERKVWRVIVAHLHNAARELWSPSWCFQSCQQILAKISFVIFDIVVKKKQIECGLALRWWNSTHLGLSNWQVFNQPIWMQKLLLVYYHSENRATSQFWKVLPNMVFSPDLGEKWRRSEHAHASYRGLFFRPPGFSPFMGREEISFPSFC